MAKRQSGFGQVRRRKAVLHTASSLAILLAATLTAAPIGAQSLPSDAMLTHSLSDRGPNLLLNAPLRALKVATLDLSPGLGSGLGFTLPEAPALVPPVPPQDEDSYAYPPPLVLAPAEPVVAAVPPAANDVAGQVEPQAGADLPMIFGPSPAAPAQATTEAPTTVASLPPAVGVVASPPEGGTAQLPPESGMASKPPASSRIYLELALDSLLSLPNIEDEIVAADDMPNSFGPDLTGADISAADIIDPHAIAPRQPSEVPPQRAAGGIGSDAHFPLLPDDQGWADAGATAPDGGKGLIYRDPTIVFGIDPETFPAQPFEHAALGLPLRMPLPTSAPADRDTDFLTGRSELGGGIAGLTFAERLSLTGPARARAEKCLAEAIYFESRGEPKRGQIAVAQVVMNRVFSGYYPKDVCKTVYQNAHRKLACQFTFACDNVKDVVREPDMWLQAKEISSDMLDGKIWLDSVGRATHYHAYWVSPRWVREMRKLDKIGVHTFYRPRNWGGG
ncbi:cell wall hydrolase [Xanthobacteraceae bacterium A53D]